MRQRLGQIAEHQSLQAVMCLGVEQQPGLTEEERQLMQTVADQSTKGENQPLQPGLKKEICQSMQLVMC